jgi:hypothetical protein
MKLTPTQSNIISALCLTGRYPLDQLSLIVTDDMKEATTYRALLRMRDEKLITVNWKGGYATQSKTTKEKKPKTGVHGAEKVIQLCHRRKSDKDFGLVEKIIIENLGSEVFEYYEKVAEVKNRNGSSQTVMRDLRKAEVMIICQRAGVKVFPFEKAQIGPGTTEISEASFYDSVEIKRAEILEIEKIARSRYIGLLFSEGGIYTVYNFRSNNMQLVTQREQQVRMVFKDTVANMWTPPQSMNQNYKSITELADTIIFGHDDEEVLTRFMSSEKNPFSSLAEVYRNIYYAPVGTDAPFQIWLLTQKEWRERLLGAFIVKDFIEQKNTYRTHDAYIPGEDLYVLCWADANLSRLRVIAREMQRNSKRKYAILALPWQTEIIKKYVKGNYTIMPLTQAGIKKAFEKGG